MKRRGLMEREGLTEQLALVHAKLAESTTQNSVSVWLKADVYRTIGQKVTDNPYIDN